MNSKEFLKAVDNIVKEKNIDKSIVYEAMQQALTSAYKKNYNTKNSNVKVLINEKTGEIKVYSYLTVVEDEKMTREEYEDYLFEHYTDEDEEEEVESKEDEGEQEEKEKISFFNPECEIRLTDARKIDKSLNVGDTIDTEVTPHDFGRVAASTAKQVVIIAKNNPDALKLSSGNPFSPSSVTKTGVNMKIAINDTTIDSLVSTL